MAQGLCIDPNLSVMNQCPAFEVKGNFITCSRIVVIISGTAEVNTTGDNILTLFKSIEEIPLTRRPGFHIGLVFKKLQIILKDPFLLGFKK